MMMMMMMMMMIISKFNGSSTPKGSYSTKTGVNCPMSPSRVQELHYVRAFAVRPSLKNVRQDLIPRVRHGEAALMHPRGSSCEWYKNEMLDQ